MYEKGIAGHIVACLLMTEEQTCKVYLVFSFKLFENNNLIK
jgi:hypothetical protein